MHLTRLVTYRGAVHHAVLLDSRSRIQASVYWRARQRHNQYVQFQCTLVDRATRVSALTLTGPLPCPNDQTLDPHGAEPQFSRRGPGLGSTDNGWNESTCFVGSHPRGRYPPDCPRGQFFTHLARVFANLLFGACNSVYLLLMVKVIHFKQKNEFQA